MAEFIKVKCKNCGNDFLRNKGHYNENLKLGHNFYCSGKCEFKYKTNRIILECENCGRLLQRTPRALSPHNYCSQHCAAIINNKNRKERGAATMKCKNCEKKFKVWVTGNKKYCSKYCQAQKSFYTKEKIIKLIKNTAENLNRTPARREMSGGLDKACLKIFGSWNKAIIAAGFEPNRSHEHRMYKRVKVKARDGHLCDSISEAIIDNWLVENNIAHERNVCYPKTKHKADWAVYMGKENTFIEYFGLANDSPRYDRAIKEKKFLCQKNKIRLIEIYHWDLYPKRYFEIKLKNSLKIK